MQHRFLLVRGNAGTAQHWLLNHQPGENTLDIRNSFPFDSYSAVSFDAWNSHVGTADRGAAVGYANPSHKGSVFDDSAFIEADDLGDFMREHAPPAFRLVQTGNLTGISGNHLRMEFTPQGDIYFYRPGVYPNQKPAMMISSNGDVVVFGNLTVKGVQREWTENVSGP
jgi:hypothetical protein